MKTQRLFRLCMIEDFIDWNTSPRTVNNDDLVFFLPRAAVGARNQILSLVTIIAVTSAPEP